MNAQKNSPREAGLKYPLGESNPCSRTEELPDRRKPRNCFMFRTLHHDGICQFVPTYSNSCRDLWHNSWHKLAGSFPGFDSILQRHGLRTHSKPPWISGLRTSLLWVDLV
jgi:hypothetical protein